MRTTLSIDDDVLDKAKNYSEQNGLSFKQTINQALRLGLQQFQTKKKPKTYSTTPQAMGLKAGHSLDKISELLAQIEGEEYK